MQSYKDQYIIENAICFKEMAIESYTRFKNLSGDDSVRHQSYLTAAATNLTFAIELALKSLCTITNSRFSTLNGDGHDLQKLFHSLPAHIQKRLINSYNYHKNHKLEGDVRPHAIYQQKHDIEEIGSLFNNYSSKLEVMLETHKKAFILWRYNFEGRNSIIFLDYHHLILFFDLVRNAVEHEFQKLVEIALAKKAAEEKSKI